VKEGSNSTELSQWIRLAIADLAAKHDQPISKEFEFLIESALEKRGYEREIRVERAAI
jgi:hypothetical protein